MAILLVALLMAAIVTFMPVQNAETVHTTVLGGRALTSTVILDGFPGSAVTPHRMDLIDARAVGTVAIVRNVAILPNQEDDNICDEGDVPFAGLAILVGDAEVGLNAADFECDNPLRTWCGF